LLSLKVLFIAFHKYVLFASHQILKCIQWRTSNIVYLTFKLSHDGRNAKKIFFSSLDENKSFVKICNNRGKVYCKRKERMKVSENGFDEIPIMIVSENLKKMSLRFSTKISQLIFRRRNFYRTCVERRVTRRKVSQTGESRAERSVVWRITFLCCPAENCPPNAPPRIRNPFRLQPI